MKNSEGVSNYIGPEAQVCGNSEIRNSSLFDKVKVLGNSDENATPTKVLQYSNLYGESEVVASGGVSPYVENSRLGLAPGTFSYWLSCGESSRVNIKASRVVNSDVRCRVEISNSSVKSLNNAANGVIDDSTIENLTTAGMSEIINNKSVIGGGRRSFLGARNISVESAQITDSSVSSIESLKVGSGAVLRNAGISFQNVQIEGRIESSSTGSEMFGKGSLVVPKGAEISQVQARDVTDLSLSGRVNSVYFKYGSWSKSDFSSNFCSCWVAIIFDLRAHYPDYYPPRVDWVIVEGEYKGGTCVPTEMAYRSMSDKNNYPLMNAYVFDSVRGCYKERDELHFRTSAQVSAIRNAN